jgi:murein DD-endopeptidase MepM/ murein hydrolase activator NlpD
MKNLWKKWYVILSVLVMLIILAGMIIPDELIIPVDGGTSSDWNHDTFWHSPWGASGVHKGIDIFAAGGTAVVSSTTGIVLFSGKSSRGGNVIAILGPKWRIHYYAHLKTFYVDEGALVKRGRRIGEVGTTGNAAGKPPHLHYTILTAVPYPWRVTSEPQGWKKIIYLNPHELLKPERGKGLRDGPREEG